jgi:hypothetical protein
MDNKEGIDHVPIRHLTMVAPIAAGLVLTEGHVKVSWDLQNSFKDWSQFLFGSWRNNLNNVAHTATQGYVQPEWGYFEWTEQIISINPYKLIQTLFVMILKNIFIFSK